MISAYDGKKEADELENLCIKATLNQNQYIVRHRYYSEDQDFGITLTIELVDEYHIPTLQKPLKKVFIFHLILFLDYQGDVLMCPHDWGKKNYLGNLNNENLIDIWFSKRSIRIRKC